MSIKKKIENKEIPESPGNFGQYVGDIQPVDYFASNIPGSIIANIIKYSVRHKKKNKKEDVFKAIWYLDRLQEIVDKNIDKVGVWDFIEAQPHLDEDQVNIVQALDTFLSTDDADCLKEVRQALDRILSKDYE